MKGWITEWEGGILGAKTGGRREREREKGRESERQRGERETDRDRERGLLATGHAARLRDSNQQQRSSHCS